MGGIYSKNDQTTANANNPYGASFSTPNISTPSQNRNDYSNLNSTYNQRINSNLPAHNLLQLSNSRERPPDEIHNFRYLPDNSPYQQRNISVSPSQLLSNAYKSQTFASNQPPIVLNSGSHQNRPIQVLQHLTPRNESASNPYIQSSGGKMSINSSTPSSTSMYPMPQQQPPYKRPRLTQDFNLTPSQHKLPATSTNLAAYSQQYNANSSNNANSNNNTVAAANLLASLSAGNLMSRSSPANNNNNKGSIGGFVGQNNAAGINVPTVKEPSYYPQVEAISPVPEELRQGEINLLSEKENISEQLRTVNGEIDKIEQQLTRLEETKKEMKEKLNSANFEVKEEEHVPTVPQDPIQSILADNHRKARQQHQVFEKLCGDKVSWSPLALPLYRQPSDVKALSEIKVQFHSRFKPLLVNYIRKRKLAERARLKILADNYETAAKAWYKRKEKSQNSLKRKQKEAKYRDIFEKTFPEIRRNREERERDDYQEINAGYKYDSFGSNGGISRHSGNNSLHNSNSIAGGMSGHSIDNNTSNNNTSVDSTSSSTGNGASSDSMPLCANTRSVTNLLLQEQRDQQRLHSHHSPCTTPPPSQRELDRMREYAIDPPIILPPWHRRQHEVVHASRLIKNPQKQQQRSFQEINLTWSSEEKKTFCEQFVLTPKNFGRISSHLTKKSVRDCVQYYYLTKKANKYKTLVKKNNARRRRERRIPRNEDTTIQSDNITNTGDDSSNHVKLDPFITPSLFMVVSQNNTSTASGGHYSTANNKNTSISTSSISHIKTERITNCTNILSNNSMRCSTEADTKIGKNNHRKDGDGSDKSDGDNDLGNIGSASYNSAPNNNGNTFRSSSSSSQNTKTEPQKNDEKSNQDNHSNMSSNSDTKRRSKELQSENKSIKQEKQVPLLSNSSNGGVPIHVHDVINFSIEQNLSRTNQKSAIAHLSNENEEIGGKTLKSPNKSTSNSQKSENNAQKSAEDNSCASNRAILMKDFCTAQMLNQITTGNDNKDSISPEKSINSKAGTNQTASIVTAAATLSADPFIDRVSKLYEEEVEIFIKSKSANNNNVSQNGPLMIPSTSNSDFRDRSDSQRTRTSSEAANYYKMMKIKKQKALTVDNHANTNMAKQNKSASGLTLEEKNNTVKHHQNMGMPPPHSLWEQKPPGHDSSSDSHTYKSPKKDFYWHSSFNNKSTVSKVQTSSPSFYDSNNNNIALSQQYHHSHRHHHSSQQSQVPTHHRNPLKQYPNSHHHHQQHSHHMKHYSNQQSSAPSSSVSSSAFNPVTTSSNLPNNPGSSLNDLAVTIGLQIAAAAKNTQNASSSQLDPNLTKFYLSQHQKHQQQQYHSQLRPPQPPSSMIDFHSVNNFDSSNNPNNSSFSLANHNIIMNNSTNNSNSNNNNNNNNSTSSNFTPSNSPDFSSTGKLLIDLDN